MENYPEKSAEVIAEEWLAPAVGNPHVKSSDYPVAALPWILAVLQAEIEPPLFLVCLLTHVPLLAHLGEYSPTVSFSHL